MAALLLRTIIVCVPLAVSYLATMFSVQLLRAQIAESRWWLLPVGGVSVLVCAGVERVTRRLLPLAALLKLTMLFPDRAPSRFKVARRAMAVNRLVGQRGPQPEPTAATEAERALALITALTAHDRRTRGHSERVRLFTDLLGEQLRLTREDRDKLRWSALLHDIGKLQVAETILNKPAKLSATEWDLVSAHPGNGEQLLGPLIGWLGEWGAAVRQHHEKYDGTGYPDGMAGTDISRAGRIVAIADAYEVMTAHRAYKKPMATMAARTELAECAGSHFDPSFVRAFLAISLPRLLWAMGPASLLMNLPMLRALADTANKGALATAQSSVLTAGAAAVITGVAGTTAVHGVPPPRPAQLAAASQQQVTQPAPAPVVQPARNRPHIPAPVQSPAVPPAGDSVVPPTTPAAPPPPSLVPAPPTAAPPSIEFSWVPYPTIATSTASVGFVAEPTAVEVICTLDSQAPIVCTGTSATFSGLSDGPHTITVQAVDAAGRAGPSISTSVSVDTVSPPISWLSQPAATVATGDVTLAFVTDDPTSTTWCSLDGAAASVCASPLSLTGLADGPHAVSVYAVDRVGNVGAAIQSSFTVDTTAPTVTLTATPPPVLTSRSVSIGFTVDDPAATSYCSLDGAPAIACTSPVNLTGLADGAHRLSIYAIDSLGNVGSAVEADFGVDASAPNVTAILAPTAPVTSKSVSIPFTLDDPTATAWCSIDGAAATPCTSPVQSPNLADGTHTIAIYAVDPAGNVGPISSASFDIQASAPTVTITAPPPLTGNPSGTVAFSVDVPGSTAWCSLDGAAPIACTSPFSYSGLGDGKHTLDIYAVNPGGIQGATASTSFTVDTAAPVVTLTAAPTGVITSAQARLSYTVNDPSATVWCSIDSGAATACASPLDLTSLPEGPHTVSVYATDLAGNTGPSRQASFTIDNTAPTVTITSAPPASSTSRTATVGFAVDDPAATVWCALDGNAATRCSGNSVTYAGLTDGSHTITVHAVDPAGNVGRSVSATFTVATAAPVFLTTPPAKSSVKTASFTWIPDFALHYQYSYDGLTWLSTSSNWTQTNTLKNGTYTFRLRGIDSHGNVTAISSFTFRIT